MTRAFYSIVYDIVFLMERKINYFILFIFYFLLQECVAVIACSYIARVTIYPPPPSPPQPNPIVGWVASSLTAQTLYQLEWKRQWPRLWETFTNYKTEHCFQQYLYLRLGHLYRRLHPIGLLCYHSTEFMSPQGFELTSPSIGVIGALTKWLASRMS